MKIYKNQAQPLRKRIAALLLFIAMISSLCITASADIGAGAAIDLESERLLTERVVESTDNVIPTTTEVVETPKTQPVFSEADESSGSISKTVGEYLNTDKHIAYVKGFNEKEFAPNNNITRAQAAQMFYNLLREEPEDIKTFDDVPEGSWMEKAVGGLAYIGAIEGMPDGSFAPDSYMTRAQFVTIASRFASMKDGTNLFSDVDISSWYAKYVVSACSYEWIDGFPNGTFQPEGNVTRAQAVKIINAMLGRKADQKVANIIFTVHFDDVSEEHWAYSEISEAATAHDHVITDGREYWVVTQNDVSHWEKIELTDDEGNVISEEQKYFDAFTQDYASGFTWISDRVLYFDPDTGYLLTGWHNINGGDYLLPTRDEELFPMEIGQYLTKVNYRASNRDWQDIKYVTVHYTAIIDDTAYGDCAAFYDTYRAASAQYFVDENSIWQMVRDEDIAWHVGNDVYYHEEARNENTIGIEMCVKKVDRSTVSAYDKDWYFLSGTEENSAALARGLMMKYAVPIQNLIRHNDVTHKVCPAMYVQDFNEWLKYLNLVTRYEFEYNGSYDVRVTSSSLEVRSGPGTDYTAVKTLARNEIATVYEERLVKNTYEGRWARIGEDEWVNLPYVSRLGIPKR